MSAKLVLAALGAVIVLAAGTATAEYPPQESVYVPPSFECALARTADERAICDSVALSLLDREMGLLYEDIRGCRAMGGRPVFEAEQARWVRARRACGGDKACLAGRYQARIDALAPTAKRARDLAAREECPGV